MKNYYTYLSSMFIALLISTMVNAQELNVNTSGFITATTFSDRDWYPFTDSIALNEDVTYGEFAIRSQFVEPRIHLIRRLTAEYSMPLITNTDITFQAGQFPRLTSIYDVSDSPGNSGLAILPLGLYNRRTVRDLTFNAMRGVNFTVRNKTDNGVLTFRGAYGKLFVENQCTTQQEVFGVKSCSNDYELYGTEGNYDYGITWQEGRWYFVAYRISFLGGTKVINPANPVADYIASNASSLQYTEDSLGIVYNHIQGIYFGAEILRNNQYAKDINKGWHSTDQLIKGYVEVGWTFNDMFSMYGELNYGKTRSNEYTRDDVIGVHFSYKRTVTSFEFHHGEGINWVNYNSPSTKWNSFVLSTTYTF